MTEYALEYDKFLLSMKAFEVNFEKPYVLSSELKLPLYCDNRLIFSHSSVFVYAIHALKEMITTYFPNVQVIAGVSTAGIPHGAVLAYLLQLPFVYIRANPKGYGQGKQIEGVIHPGQNVLIIEDLIFKGVASMQAVESVKAAGGNVIGIAALFTYGLNSVEEMFVQNNVLVHTISHMLSLIETAYKTSYITEDQKQKLLEWHANPFIWKPALAIAV